MLAVIRLGTHFECLRPMLIEEYLKAEFDNSRRTAQLRGSFHRSLGILGCNLASLPP